MAYPLRIQAALADFQLHTLGWKAFQDLCATIWREVVGQTFQIFNPTRDGGRDGFFEGAWTPSVAAPMVTGTFTVQCKFVHVPDALFSVATMSEDIQKAGDLASRGVCDHYVLMTNASITGDAESKLRDAFKGSPVQSVRAYGRESITQFILATPRLRRLVPRIYGLGDITSIPDLRHYAQAEQLLVSIKDDLAKFVPTASYRRAARALADHGFVLLLGEPAAGKSTIAATLALSALDEWKLLPIKIDTPEQFTAAWNPQEPDQFFWIDDMFGDTQYQPALADRWNKVLLRLSAAVKAGVRVVATSRDYIYKRAASNIKEASFPLLRESRVIVNVQDLTTSEKADILYVHLRRGDQPIEFRRDVKAYLDQVSFSKHFRPEIARRLGTKFFTQRLSKQQLPILKFFEEPEGFLVDVIQGLESNDKAALALVFMRGGRLESPVVFADADVDAIERLGGTKGGVTQALSSLAGSLTRQIDTDNGRFWTFQHPTIADAFGSSTAANAELLDIYLRGTPTSKFIHEITCGISVDGAKIDVPPTRYDVIADRLHAYRDAWVFRRLVYWFLSSRCSGNFS